MKPLVHHALKHSNASIILSPREFLSGAMRFLALLKARSHSQEVAGQANISKAKRWKGREGFFYIWLTPLGYRIKLLSGGDSRTGHNTCLIRRLLCLFSRPPTVEAGRPSGTKSWARSVSVPIALLRSSLRSGSVFIAFEVTAFGYRRGKTCRERAISLTSRLTPIYTIYGLLSTTSGLGVHHTGPAGRIVGSTGAPQRLLSSNSAQPRPVRSGL
jgi:hypothetical protein